MSLRKNQMITLEITGISHEGDGIGRFEGIVVFVPGSAVGDRLSVRVVKALEKHCYGIIEEIIKPSPDRQENDCPYYKACGGCTLRHITPEAELRAKGEMLSSNLSRIGGISLEPEPPLDCPSYERYRNKAAFPVRMLEGRVAYGFFARHSHRLTGMTDCLLQPEFFADITECVRGFCERNAIPPYDEEAHKGLLRHIMIRHAAATDEVMVTLVINGASLPGSDDLTKRLLEACPRVKTLVLDHNTKKTNVIEGGRKTVLYGPGTITDVLRGIRVRLSPGSFYQVNREAAELLYAQVQEYAAPEPEDTLLDLYCGAGTIGLSMARGVKEVIGVELVPAAVHDARRTAAENGIENARFLCMDAGKAAQKLREEGVSPDIVLLDPPRAGLDENTVSHVAAMAPRRVVYISCNSATLARDCARFGEYGYRATGARAVNMFARTSHVEAVVLLRPAGSSLG